LNTSIENKLASNYWVNKLKSYPVINDIPLILFETKECIIKKNELSYFNKLTGNNEVVEFTVLLSIFNDLLQRYFETVNFIASSGIEKDQQILLYKFGSIKRKTFKECLNEVKAEVQEVFKYENYDESSVSTNSFCKYTSFGFSYNDNFHNNKSDFPFLLNIKKKEEGLIISISYDENFTNEYVCNHFLENIKRWLLKLGSNINEDVNTLPIISKQEKEKVLYAFNNTTVEYPKNKTIVDLFEEQVKKTPDSIALVFEDQKLTYGALNIQANQLADYLVKEYKIESNDLIGMKIGRSDQLLVTILGILKSGAAYVPIDNDYPKHRIAYIEEDCQCKLIIDQETLDKFIHNRDLYATKNISRIYSPEDLAYVMYTSGTTGNSKGVMVEHRNVIRLVKPCTFFPLNVSTILLSTGSISFDATIIEYFGILLNGGKLIIALKEDLLDTNKLKKIINNFSVNSMWMTASWFSQVVDQDIHVFDNISQLIVGGDVVSPLHILKLFKKYPKINIVNGYGPTENTTFSTTFQIKNEVYSKIPIGKPISNSYTYILDDNLEPLPIGVSGKLYVSGGGVARGYLNNLELTAERFLSNPFLEGERLYDTGDIAKWLPSGNLEFLGRKDSQVKIRGYRIELEEIENTIIQFSDDIQQVVLDIKQTESEKELVAYYVCKSNIDKAELRSFLKERLSSYMIPSYYVMLDEIPLTANGKVHKKALPEITSEALVQKEYVAPRNEIEKKLIEIWQEVLGVKRIGITDNFFELGGHSLLVGQIINRIHKQLNKSISFKSFFVTPTIKKIGKILSSSVYNEIPQIGTKPYYPLTTSQHRIWVLSQLEGGNLAYNTPGAVKLKGDLDVIKFQEAFKTLIKRHEILRTNFRVNESGEIHQYVREEDTFEFNILEKDVINQTKEEIEILLEEEHAMAFDLANSLLVRVTLFKTQEEEHIFSLTMHHIIGDGWSMELLISEIITFYNDLIQNKEYCLPKLDIQYKDYAVWLESELTKEHYKASETYWLSQFQGELPILDVLIAFQPLF